MFRRKEESYDTKDSTTDTKTGSSSAGSSSTSSSGFSSGSTSSGATGLQRQPSEASKSPSSSTSSTATTFRPTAPSAAREPRGAVPNPADKSKNRRVLTVGNDILLKGEIATCDRLVIEGKVEATLNDVHTVEIAESGSFKGTAKVEDAEISGLFEGELEVRSRLIIYATGRVSGKITYGEIEIERGGQLTGEIKTNTTASSRETKPKAA